MPGSVVVAAVVLFLLCLTFCIIPVVAYRYGDAAERAAEGEVVRQGFPVAVLAEHRIRFAETGRETLFPFGIAAALATLGSLDLAGVSPARVITWVVAGVLLIGGGFITAGQLFAARYTAAAFKRSSDPAVRTIDAQAIIDAAKKEFPSWLGPLQIVRFGLTTAGSILVIILLATSSASAHFH